MPSKHNEPGGVLAQSIAAGVEQWHAQKAAGASRDERIVNLERTLRAAWPRRRQEPWRFLCDLCLDTGWRAYACPELRCARAKPHSAHSYVSPCACTKGVRVESAVAGRKEINVEEAGQRRKMTRVGMR